MVEIRDVIAEMNTQGPAQPCHSSLESAHDQRHFQGFTHAERPHAYTAADADGQAVHRKADGYEKDGD